MSADPLLVRYPVSMAVVSSICMLLLVVTIGVFASVVGPVVSGRSE